MNWNLRTNDYKMSSIQGELVLPSQKELLSAGLKKLAFFWLFAAICLPFPGLHFILVPYFLIYGIWSFFKVQQNKTLARTGSYVCPECQSKHQIQKIFINPGDKWRCNQCGAQMLILKMSN